MMLPWGVKAAQNSSAFVLCSGVPDKNVERDFSTARNGWKPLLWPVSGGPGTFTLRGSTHLEPHWLVGGVLHAHLGFTCLNKTKIPSVLCTSFESPQFSSILRSGLTELLQFHFLAKLVNPLQCDFHVAVFWYLCLASLRPVQDFFDDHVGWFSSKYNKKWYFMFLWPKCPKEPDFLLYYR